MTPAAEKMIAALLQCPCCRASRTFVNIPSRRNTKGYIHESVFGCGSRVQLDAIGMATVGAACPYPLDDALYEIQRRIEEEAAR